MRWGREFFLASVNLGIDYLAALREGDQVTATRHGAAQRQRHRQHRRQVRHTDGKLIAAPAQPLQRRLPNPFQIAPDTAQRRLHGAKGVLGSYMAEPEPMRRRYFSRAERRR